MVLKTRLTLISLVTIVAFAVLLTIHHYGSSISRNSEGVPVIDAGTSETFLTRVVTETESRPAQLIDRGAIHDNGSYTADFWIPDSEVNFRERSAVGSDIEVEIITDDKNIQDVVISTFQLDRNFQPIAQHTINCVKSGSGNRQKCSFEDNGGGRYLLTYRGDEPSLATVQFSEGSSSKENFGLYKSTWLL